MKPQRKEIYFYPYGAALLEQKTLAWSLLLTALFLAVLRFAGVTVWNCPFHQLTGLQCPGCGMTTAMAALLRGEIARAWRLHPFSILLAAGWLLMLIIMILPPGCRKIIIEHLEQLERKTGLVLLMLLLFLFFGLVRLLGEMYFRLVS